LLRPVVIAAFTLTASAATAEPARLDEDAIKASLAGAKVAFDSPLGITVPVEFGTDGLVSGETMALAAVLGAAKDRGRWWVADGKLCSKWFRWFDAEQRCAIVSRDGDRLVFNADDGKTGTATILVPAPVVKHEADKKKPAPVIAVAKAAPPPVATPHPQAPVQVREQPQASDVKVLNSLASLAAPTAQAAEVPDSRPPPALSPAPKAAVGRAAAKSRQGGVPSAAQASRNPVGAMKTDAKSSAKSKSANATKVTAWSGESMPVYRVARVEDDDSLNVREGPSENHDTIAELAPDQRNVAITGPCRNDWCPIRQGRTVGWVNRYYLAEEPRQAAGASKTRR
jgi:SH3-like domain-containing protein